MSVVRPSLPKRREKGVTDGALREFASQNVLSLVTAMCERDIATATGPPIWHLPHVTRSLIKLRPHEATMKHQKHLRRLTVHHVLSAAMRNLDRYDRSFLIEILLGMRDRNPFKKIREILANEGVLIMQPDAQSERQASKALQEITFLAGTKPKQRDNLICDRNSALRQIGQARAGDYEYDLDRVFPELKPVRQ